MRRTCLSIVLACAAGCATSGVNNNGKLTAQEQTPTELAAYAGHATYPTTMPAQDLRAAAIVGPGKKYIKVYNFSAEPVRDADIWVNGAFVQHIDGIAAQSSVTLRSDQIYNAMGKNFASQDEPVSRVQLKSADGLYTLQGPAAE